MEAIGYLPPEDQQSAREALKNEKLTPALLAALILKLDETVRETRAATPAESGLITKVELLTNALRGIEQRLKETTDTRVVTPSDTKGIAKLDETVRGLREDMRGLQDGLAALRPYHRGKVIAAFVVVFALGCVAGWYGRIEYRIWQNEHASRTR